MSRTPTISVILITRDRPALLADALVSVAAQTLPPVEIRIGDAGDVHPARDLSAGEVPVTLVRAPARRAAGARNRAAAGARCEVLAFLDDDDRWLPDHLSGLARAFADPGVALAYRDAAVIRESIDPDGSRRDRERRVIARDWDAALMRTDDFVPPSAVAVRRELFERLGGFDEAFRYSDDWDFLLRAARQAVPRRVPGVSVEVRMRESGNASSEQGAERRADLDRLSERHGLPPLVPRTFWEVAALVAGAS